MSVTELMISSTIAAINVMADSLTAFHENTKATSGLDIVGVSLTVKESIPPYNIVTGAAVVVGSVIAWAKVVPAIAQTTILPLMSYSKGNRPRELKKLVGMIHGLVAAVGALLCFFYADGKAMTTWHHCQYFKLHMFDSQKYLLSITLGFHINRLIQRTIYQEWDNLKVSLNLLMVVNLVLALYTAGFIGSLN